MNLLLIIKKLSQYKFFLTLWKLSIPLYIKKKIHLHIKDIEINNEIQNHISKKDNYKIINLQNINYINSPVILISQLPRSGGSLLAQLLDSHVNVHSFPDEFKIGHPIKYIWPKLKINKGRPEYWFNQLFNRELPKIKHNQYWKGHQHKFKKGLNFAYVPKIHHEIFIKLLKLNSNLKIRDIFDTYLTSFFYSWIDYKNMSGKKKYIIAFQPMLKGIKKYVENFFKVYPDGYHIGIIRNPYDWYNSCRLHDSINKSIDDYEEAINKWLSFNDNLFELKRKYKEKVIIINYESLINQTELTMKKICKIINLKFDSSLLYPTFNSYHIMANSSYPINQYGVINKNKSSKEEIHNNKKDDFTLQKKIDKSLSYYLSNLDI